MERKFVDLNNEMLPSCLLCYFSEIVPNKIKTFFFRKKTSVPRNNFHVILGLSCSGYLSPGLDDRDDMPFLRRSRSSRGRQVAEFLNKCQQVD